MIFVGSERRFKKNCQVQSQPTSLCLCQFLYVWIQVGGRMTLPPNPPCARVQTLLSPGLFWQQLRSRGGTAMAVSQEGSLWCPGNEPQLPHLSLKWKEWFPCLLCWVMRSSEKSHCKVLYGKRWEHVLVRYPFELQAVTHFPYLVSEAFVRKEQTYKIWAPRWTITLY